MLRDHRRQQLELRLALGQGGQPALVFSDVEGNCSRPTTSAGAGDGSARAEAAGGELPRAAPHARLDADPRRRRHSDDQPPDWPPQGEHHARHLRALDGRRRRRGGEGNRGGAEMKVKQALTAATCFCREAYRWVSRGIASISARRTDRGGSDTGSRIGRRRNWMGQRQRQSKGC